MKYIFLSKQFYLDYDNKNYPEIEQKENRPYVLILVNIQNLQFAIPFRSHIKHNSAFLTDKINKCGLDYTKAIVVTNQDYILYTYNGKKIKIRNNEHKKLIGKEYKIIKELERYIKNYKRAVKNKVNTKFPIFQYSTLQYFHKELGL